ncbi:MAG TPA: MSMEG_4193 family putative phosphomutase [Candidatus Nanopelagicales bacterium]
MAIVLLVRHGRTPANAQGLLAGRTSGVVLDAAGRRQARSLAGRLRGVALTAVVHSPLERCVETTDLMLAGRDPSPPRHVDDRLIECDYGAWTGQRLAELAKDPLWASVQATPSAVRFPQGEAMQAMADRAVASARDWAAREPEGVLALVSHGDVIKAILSDALGQPFDAFQRIAVSPASVSVVAYGSHGCSVLGMNLTSGRLRMAPAAAAPTVGGGAA